MNDIARSPAREANPFAHAQVAARPSGGGALSQSDQQRAIAEVQAAMMIARMNPRDPVEALDRILNACTRASLAETAIYQYSRGGADITGPSIRLAEAVAQQWGNIHFGIRELEQRPGESVVQAFAWDLETNVRREMTFAVAHVRSTKAGNKRLEDPRDIYELVANQGARRLRACLLSVIPGDVVEAAVAQCEATLSASADTSPEAVKKMIGAFAAFGVSKEQIERRIQRRIESITPAQMVQLRKIYASLKDGMSKPIDWFETIEDEGGAEEPVSRTEAVKNRLRERRTSSHAEAPQASVVSEGAPDEIDPELATQGGEA